MVSGVNMSVSVFFYVCIRLVCWCSVFSCPSRIFVWEFQQNRPEIHVLSDYTDKTVITWIRLFTSNNSWHNRKPRNKDGVEKILGRSLEKSQTKYVPLKDVYNVLINYPYHKCIDSELTYLQIQFTKRLTYSIPFPPHFALPRFIIKSFYQFA